MKQHKFSEVIKAWVDGVECERLNFDTKIWKPIQVLTDFTWADAVRIKPEPKPDVIRLVAAKNNEIIRLIFNGETGNLLGAEVLK